ncbi:MAG: hypothetical protein IKR92_02250 [Alphaproteobacteria bacterium]|nr:hypothetical protein [Alphaproteobacteria bacterium]
MSALKNRIRTLFCAVALAFSLPAQAQILGMGINFEKLNLPEPFLQNLEKCQTYKFMQTAANHDIEVKTTYSITPTENKLCRLYIEGHTNVLVHISQDCKLTLEQAKNYAEALRRYQAKGYSPRWDGHKIEKDLDYLAAYQIMSDRKLCRFVRQEVDFTKEIRKNLPQCTPTTQEEITAAIKVERQIQKAQDDKCLYSFKVTQLPSKDTAGTVRTIGFNCALDSALRERYLQILEALVLPEEEGYDFSTVQRISVAEELDFILDNCALDTEH